MSDSAPSFIDTPLLRMAYEERGARGAPPVLLVHGWPDAARTWEPVAGALAAAGYRTIAPSLRGFGATRFHAAATPRSGQIAALARDLVDLLDALGLPRVTLVGHDWGARAGYAAAALFPERVARLVACCTGYETGIKAGDRVPPEQLAAYWYQWFFHSERGREALEGDRRALCELIWRRGSPGLALDPAEYAATAAAWDNPDWVAITLHSYRVRWGGAERDPRYAELEARLAERPAIGAPTTVLHGAEDGLSLAASSAHQEASFRGPYRRVVVPGAGHFLTREAPAAIVEAVLRGG